MFELLSHTVQVTPGRLDWPQPPYCTSQSLPSAKHRLEVMCGPSTCKFKFKLYGVKKKPVAEAAPVMQEAAKKESKDSETIAHDPATASTPLLPKKHN